MDQPWGDTVLVEFDEGIAWVTLNRPDKRNAMNPALNDEMVRVLDHLEGDDRCRVLVLTGAGESFSAGMDLKEYFRDVDATGSAAVQAKVRRASAEWQWKRLSNWLKPTIAMVNGWCFGGAFTPLVACDLAFASETAQFGLSEVNWGIPPGGVVSRALAATVSRRDALYHIMTGEPFDGRAAAAMRLVNEAVPASSLRERTRTVAAKLAAGNPRRAARRQGRLQDRRRNALGAGRRLPLREARTIPVRGQRGCQSQRHEPIPGRQDLPAWPERVRPGRVGPMHTGRDSHA